MQKENCFPAFKILSNLYFVGTEAASTHIVDTTEGLIMLDSGYLHSLPIVLENMKSLSLDYKNIKYIIHTHGHIDHFGATKALVDLTGAKTVIGRKDRYAANGQKDLSFAREMNMQFTETFEPDILLDDGDEIILGATKITAVATPGHTEGCMSYFFEIEDSGKIKRVGLLGGTGFNSMTREYLDSKNLPYSLREDFIASMERLKGERVDIFLGNHAFQNNTKGKYELLKSGKKDAFVNPNEWALYMEKMKNDMKEMLKGEK